MNVLDKEEYQRKLNEIDRLVEQKDFKGAMAVVDGIEWRKVKDARKLATVGEIYAANKRYEESMDIFLLAYHRARIGKNILIRLIDIALKIDHFDDAEEFYGEFEDIAPNDNTKYILKYKILKAKDAPLAEQIKVLEDYKDKEFTEKWSYELARLYYKAGETDKCLDLCGTIILWFSEGAYVNKTLDLKKRLGALTAEEEKQYEEQFAVKPMNEEELQALRQNLDREEEKGDEQDSDAEIIALEKTLGREEDNAVTRDTSSSNFQEKITKGLRDIFGRKKKKAEEDLSSTEIQTEDYPEQMNIKHAETDTVDEAPELEPEKLETQDTASSEKQEEDAALTDAKPENQTQEFTFKQPKPLKIPAAMKTSSLPSPEIIKQIMDERKKAEEEAAASAHKKEEKKEDELEFNLEATILAAASAQGIDLGLPKPADETEVENVENTSSSEEESVENETPLEEDEEEAEAPTEVEIMEDGVLLEDEPVEAQAPPEENEEEAEAPTEVEIVEDGVLLEDEPVETQAPPEENEEKAETSFEESQEEPQNIHEDIFDDSDALTGAIQEGLERLIREVQREAEKASAALLDNVQDKMEEELLHNPADDSAFASSYIEDEELERISGVHTGRSAMEEADDFEEDQEPIERGPFPIPNLTPFSEMDFDAPPPRENPAFSPELQEKAMEFEREIIEKEDGSSFSLDDLEEKIGSHVNGLEEDDASVDQLLEREATPERKKFDAKVNKILKEGKKNPDELTEEEKLEDFIDSMHSEEIDPTKIIPRKRELTEEEKIMFSYFVMVPGMKEQIIDTLCDVQNSAADKTSRTGNIVVMGARETGKTHLISNIIPAICKELYMEAAKVAYVFAEQINGKDMAKIISKLSGGFLVIENANQLDQETAESLNKAMEFRTDGLTVIVEDEKIGMRKFLARYPKLAKKFTSMINIPVFTNDELVNFAKIYTRENGYSIDQMGMLALYNSISQNQKADEPMTIGSVKTMLDEAIAKSQSGMRKLFSKRRTDRDGLTVLCEKDFI